MKIIEKLARAIAKSNEDDLHWKGYLPCAKEAIKVIQQEYTLLNYLDLWVKHD